MKRLLVCGGLPNEKYNCCYGGATVLMKNFCDYLVLHNYDYRFVQTNKYINSKTHELKNCKNKISFILNFIRYLFWCDVIMFNFSDHATVEMFPFLSTVAKKMKKKVALRKFGGSFELYLSKLSDSKIRRTIQALNRADMVFVETKASIQYVKSLIDNKEKVHWFPNVRRSTYMIKNSKNFSHKLVFMSHVSTEKGVKDMLTAFQRLPIDYELDLYGAITDNRFNNYDWDGCRARYKGQISAKEVIELLPNYSLLLLPSYKEGYPGIIIEAFSVGLPVISTLVGGIPEIVTDGYNGKLVKPGDINGLVEAILSFTADNYESFCVNAKTTFEAFFESDKTNSKILELLLK